MARTTSPRGLLILTGILLICLTVIVPVSANIQFQVYSNPSNAEVSVDNFWFDTTPATIQYPDSGWHTIRVSKEGYQTITRSEYCSDDGNSNAPTCVVSYDLVPNPASYGWLDINTNNAELYIDGSDQGWGSMTIPLAPGGHSLILRKPGYYDYTETIYITAGQTLTKSPGMTPYPAQPEYGSLQIDSDPAGASVFLNNAYRGIEPANGAFYITDLAPGTYTLTLLMPDYQKWTQSVQVQAGIINDIHATLIPNPAGATPDTTGQIFAYSVPNGASVYVDNAYRGFTPVTLRDIPAGSHTVTFKLNGYPDYSTVASVTGGTIINVPATFSTSQGTGTGQAAAAAVPQATKSPLGVVTSVLALVIVGGILLLRKPE